MNPSDEFVKSFKTTSTKRDKSYFLRSDAQRLLFLHTVRKSRNISGQYRSRYVVLISDRPGVTMHPAQPDRDFLTK